MLKKRELKKIVKVDGDSCAWPQVEWLSFSLQALKILKTPEFMPFVVFIAAPSLDVMKGNYKKAVAEGTATRKRSVSI